jgi:hypothetical protein
MIFTPRRKTLQEEEEDLAANREKGYYEGSCRD